MKRRLALLIVVCLALTGCSSLKDEMIQALNKTSKTVKLVDYFETFPSTKRMAQNVIWGNFIIKKLE